MPRVKARESFMTGIKDSQTALWQIGWKFLFSWFTILIKTGNITNKLIHSHYRFNPQYMYVYLEFNYLRVNKYKVQQAEKCTSVIYIYIIWVCFGVIVSVFQAHTKVSPFSSMKWLTSTQEYSQFVWVYPRISWQIHRDPRAERSIVNEFPKVNKFGNYWVVMLSSAYVQFLITGQSWNQTLNLTINFINSHRRKGSSYLASKARAMIPATMGADTEVPVWPSVQRFLRSVVT